MAISDWKVDGFDVYANSNYDFNDAETLANLWGIPVIEAKHVIGYKIVHKIEHLLPAEVSPASGEGDEHDNIFDSDVWKAYANSDYTYYDAELLSQLWGISIVEAKKTIGYKIIHGYEGDLPDKVRGNDDTDWDAKALDTYSRSQYTYQDAELLAQLWNISVYEAKKVIGYKIIDGLEHLLPNKVGGDNKVSPEGKALDAFDRCGYEYADAQLLAQLWGISVFEAKKAIGFKIIDGIEDKLPPKVYRPDSGC